jgi:hypothetical protein
MRIKSFLLVTTTCLLLSGAAVAEAKSDRFYVPQPEQAFDGEVKTRIGTLKFKNQYPSKESMETILDSMDFHGATQAFLWGIPIASFANLQYYTDNVFKVEKGSNLYC